MLFLVVCALLLLPNVVVAKQAAISRESQQALYNAQQAYKAGQFGKAVQLLTPYMQQAKAKGEAIPAAGYLMLGSAQHRLGRVKSAINAFDQGAKAHPKDPDLHMNLAIVLYEGQQVAKAADHFRTAYQRYAAIKKYKPELLYHAAISHYQANQLKSAKSDMQKLWAAKPRNVPKAWRTFWVQLLCALKDWPAAEKAVVSYLAGNRGEASFWKLLGQVRASRGRYQGAASAFQVADSLKPLSASDLRMLADLYFYMDATTSGIRTLKRAAGKNLTVKDHDRLANAYGRVMRTDDAIRHARSALKAKPTGDRLMTLAQIMADGGRHKDLLALARGISNDAAHGDVLLLGAMAALSLDDTSAMQSFLERASLDRGSADQARAWLSVLEEMETARREAQAALLEADGAGSAIQNATAPADPSATTPRQ